MGLGSTPSGRFGLCAILLITCFASAGCQLFSSNCDERDDECLGRDIKGGPVGAACERTVQCGAGLTCQAGECAPAGDSPPGADCRRTAECDDGLYCSPERRCAAAGEGQVGEVCETSADCEKGLRCDLSNRGVPFVCSETGDTELNQECSGAECAAGLSCLPFPERDDPLRCISVPLDREIPAPPTWSGPDCADDDADPVAYFKVPRDGQDADFYQLPFPNDIRIRGGAIDLSDHPAPPDDRIPVAARFIRAGDGRLTGFSTSPVVYFRFSRKPLVDETGGREAVLLIDITPGSPTYDRNVKRAWSPEYGSESKYICDNWLAVRSAVGYPLRPNTTYAAILTTSLRQEGGGAFQRDSDFEAVLESATPDDAELADAHEAYAPLRAWLDDTDMMDLDSVLNAAVFTTLDPEDTIRRLASVIDGLDPPEVTELVECADGETSPCETTDSDGNTRGACSLSDRSFTEYHGKISLPIFQEGTLPYEEEGGAIAFDDDGDPRVVERQEICFALAIPKTEAPEDGWPLLIYGHGTGGSFTGQMGTRGFAEDVAGGGAPAATLALDLPMHGLRRGDSEQDPELLFFNILNPDASRDNVLQGSADFMSLVEFARRSAVPADKSPTDEPIRFNPERVVVMGHSQGATHAALMLPYSRAVGGVLSGVGGHLVSSLLNKSEPLPISNGIGAILYDLDSSNDVATGTYNPALNLIQNFYDTADPMNFGRRVHEEPTDMQPGGFHLFMSYGRYDRYSPEETQQAYAQSASLPHVRPVLAPMGLDLVEAPARDTVTIGEAARTVAVRQYEPLDGEDGEGHFVISRPDGPGRPDAVRFLHALMAGDTPAVGD